MSRSITSKFLIVLALCLGLSQESLAAIALVQKTNTAISISGTTIPITVTSTGAGNLLIVGVQLLSGSTVTGVSDGTSAFTQATGAQVTSTAAGRTIDVWYLLSSNSGKTTITVTRSGAADTDNRIAWFMEFSGCTSCTFDLAGNVADQTCSPTTTCNGKSITTTGATGVVYGLMVESTGTLDTLTGGNEFTYGTQSGWGSADAYLISASAAAHQPSWQSTSSGDGYSALTAAFKAGGGGGGGTTAKTLMLMGIGQ